ncbi:MAG: sulfite exporter TauE/SafE family protein [Thermoplasmata archaeon]
MDPMSSVWLALTALGAAVINGAVGYGFSSVLTPIALFWYSNKVLNPALVTVEFAVNLTLLVRERGLLRATWGRARPVISTLAPGVVLGTIGLTVLAVTDVKLVVYAALFPLVALQLLGVRRPLKNERAGGMAVGTGVGFLYALTTISGPPLAIFLRNQGLSKEEFRCTIAQIRFAESSLTLGAYLAFSAWFHAGLVSMPSLALLPYLVIPVVIGVPLGALLLRSVSRESFTRVVVAVDAVIVAYALAHTLAGLAGLAPGPSDALAGAVLAATLLLVVFALRPFRHPRVAPRSGPSGSPPRPTALGGPRIPRGPPVDGPPE